MKIIIKTIIIACDYPNCRVESKYHDVTVHEAESLARDDGWQLIQDRAYCTAHQQPRRGTR